jgi:transcriptional regulator with XRE-family HTH domain
MVAQHKNIVGPQIRRLRVAAGLSQAALAAAYQWVGWDIDRNTIAKIEGQMWWVGDFELVYLAKAFKCRVGELLKER